jgi:hypothetical protein
MSNEAFRLIVIGGVIVSIFASKANKLVGGIVSSLVTTFILIFGLDAYSHSGAISFLGIRLPQSVFVLVILTWYFFDFKQIAAGIKEKGVLKQIRTGTSDKLRAGHSMTQVMADILPTLTNHPEDLRQLGGEIIQGKPFAETLKDYQGRTGKDEDQAALRYQQAVDVVNSLQAIVTGEAAAAGLPKAPDGKSYFLPAVKLTSGKTFSMTKKLLKGELVYRYNGKWVTSPEQLVAESSQVSPESSVPVRSLFKMPNNPAWTVRKMDIKGGPLNLDAVANG